MTRVRLFKRGRAAVMAWALVLATSAGCPTSLPLPQLGSGSLVSLPGASPQVDGSDGSQIGEALMGLYLAELSGSVSGHTYMEVRSGAASGEFLITTITGAGFRVSVNSSGTITVLGLNGEQAAASGSGRVIGRDSFSLNATVTGSSNFPDGSLSIEGGRLAGTDSSFPLSVTAVAPSVFLNQIYFGTITSRDPSAAGAETSLSGQQILVSVVANGLLLHLPSGDEFTVVFYEPLRAAARVVADGQEAYATLSGSGTNTEMDVLGRVDFDDLNNFSALLALQSRAALGSQTQRVVLLSNSTTNLQ
jgi:hypothetical protein